MGFAPNWILGATCGVITNRFVAGDLPLQAYTNKFSKGLVGSYQDTSSEKLMSITEEMMQFLASIDGDDAMSVNEAYIFNVVNFDEGGAKRKMKSLFKSAFTGKKKETSIEEIVKAFKVFGFKLRSSPDLAAPTGWTLAQTDDIEWLNEIFEQRIRVTDSF